MQVDLGYRQGRTGEGREGGGIIGEQRLEALREYLNSNEYIEGVAREELGLVRQGETSIVVIPTIASPTTPWSRARPTRGSMPACRCACPRARRSAPCA